MELRTFLGGAEREGEIAKMKLFEEVLEEGVGAKAYEH